MGDPFNGQGNGDLKLKLGRDLGLSLGFVLLAVLVVKLLRRRRMRTGMESDARKAEGGDNYADIKDIYLFFKNRYQEAFKQMHNSAGSSLSRV